jgi:branched-chain amino acid transport system ATP-binding protein
VTPLLEVSHVETYYGDSHVLFDLSLAVNAGEVVCLLGRNGAGKTTTVRTIIGLTPPRSGRVMLSGHDVAGLPPFRVARRGIGFVPEDRRVFPNLTVHENLEVARRPRADGTPGAWSAEHVFELFPVLRERLGTQLGRLKASGLTIVLAEQNVRFVSGLGDRVYILEKGAVRYEGAMTEFLADEQVRQAYLAV